MPKASANSKSGSSASALLKKLGLKAVNPGVFCGEWLGSGAIIESVSPIDGKVLAKVRQATPAEYETAVQRAAAAFQKMAECARSEAR